MQVYDGGLLMPGGNSATVREVKQKPQRAEGDADAAGKSAEATTPRCPLPHEALSMHRNLIPPEMASAFSLQEIESTNQLQFTSFLMVMDRMRQLSGAIQPGHVGGWNPAAAAAAAAAAQQSMMMANPMAAAAAAAQLNASGQNVMQQAPRSNPFGYVMPNAAAAAAAAAAPMMMGGPSGVYPPHALHAMMIQQQLQQQQPLHGGMGTDTALGPPSGFGNRHTVPAAGRGREGNANNGHANHDDSEQNDETAVADQLRGLKKSQQRRAGSGPKPGLKTTASNFKSKQSRGVAGGSSVQRQDQPHLMAKGPPSLKRKAPSDSQHQQMQGAVDFHQPALVAVDGHGRAPLAPQLHHQQYAHPLHPVMQQQQQQHCSNTNVGDGGKLNSGDGGDAYDPRGHSTGGATGFEPINLNDDFHARALKRPRLVWTPQLHKRFVDAVNELGIKVAVPKTIMQLMNIEGLTRENVASHLQKYRLQLRKSGQDAGSKDPTTAGGEGPQAQQVDGDGENQNGGLRGAGGSDDSQKSLGVDPEPAAAAIFDNAEAAAAVGVEAAPCKTASGNASNGEVELPMRRPGSVAPPPQEQGSDDRRESSEAEASGKASPDADTPPSDSPPSGSPPDSSGVDGAQRSRGPSPVSVSGAEEQRAEPVFAAEVEQKDDAAGSENPR